MRTLILALTALTALVSLGAYADPVAAPAASLPATTSDPTWFGNPISIERCGSPNRLGTLCVAHSASGTAYLAIISRESQSSRPAYATFSQARTEAQDDGSIIEEYEGTSAIRNPADDGVYEQVLHLSIHTASSGQNATASLSVNGKPYYKKFDFAPYRSSASTANAR